MLVWDAYPEVVGGGAQEREIGVPGVATFKVTDGHRVSITRADGADPAEVLASLDGRVTAALLQQRRTLPLHLVAVVVEDRALGFAGPPGAGKSSLACALADRGHALLTDDLGAVTYLGRRPALHPGPPVMRIWGSSADRLGWPTEDSDRVKPGVDRYAYELPERFADRPCRMAAVYVLLGHAGEEVLIDLVEGFARFETYFSGATYSREFLDTAAARAWHFVEVCRVADQVPTFTLRVPAGELPLEKLAREVERHAASLSRRA